MPDAQAMLGPNAAGTSALIGVAAALLVPVLFFYALAHIVWRGQELRLIAQSMAEVAVRLAEPESVARESIVSVGQAIRREVAAMGGGVEGAPARAAEAETLVGNQVSALGHPYSEKQGAIPGLLQDFGTQRDRLVG